MSLYCQCPQCLTVFRIAASDLRQAGIVRCGHCGSLFKAFRSLHEEAPIPIREDQEDIFPDSPFEMEEESPQPSLDFNVAVAPAQQASDYQNLHSMQDMEESFANNPAEGPLPNSQKKPAGSWLWPGLFLALLLVAQVLYLGRNALIDISLLKPLLEGMCDLTGCQIERKSDLSAIRLRDRNVQPHPRIPQALTINATLINTADFVQPYPVIQLVLSDLDAKPVAYRQFKPEDYISSPSAIEEGMQPGVLLPIHFEAVKPEKDAVAFEFVFLQSQ